MEVGFMEWWAHMLIIWVNVIFLKSSLLGQFFYCKSTFYVHLMYIYNFFSLIHSFITWAQRTVVKHNYRVALYQHRFCRRCSRTRKWSSGEPNKISTSAARNQVIPPSLPSEWFYQLVQTQHKNREKLEFLVHRCQDVHHSKTFLVQF